MNKKKKGTEGDLFINERPFKVNFSPSYINYINKVLFFLGFRYQLLPIPDPLKEMNTIENRINFYHLVKSVLDYEIPGDIIEFGCYTGQSAMLFQKVVSDADENRKIILYDSFEASFGSDRDIEQELNSNFTHSRLTMPVLVKGRFEDTLPQMLPEKIAFVNIDCGPPDQDAPAHKNLVLFLLKSIYPRLSKGAVVCLMDYFDRPGGHFGTDFHPGVKLAADEFFADKQEGVSPLYGNQCAHGYFRKL